jgi:tetratricopeptide (TPR) repeat protein
MNALPDRLNQVLGYLALDPQNVALLAEASDLALQRGDLVAARELVERTLRLQPQDAVSRYRMAVILLAERQAEQSIALTQALIDAGEQHPAVRFAHARGLAMAARFADAEPVLAALLSENASFAELPHLYIRTLHYLGRIDDALRFAQTYTGTHPDDGVGQGMLGLLYLDHGDIARAGEVSATALDHAPNNVDALLTAGSVALAYENQDQAKAHFDKALALSADSGRAWAGLGLAKMLDLDLAAARTDFEKAVQFMPTHLGSHSALAWVQILQRDYAAARATLDASLVVDRNFGETHGGLAVVAALEGDWDHAKRLADTALRLQPLLT